MGTVYIVFGIHRIYFQFETSVQKSTPQGRLRHFLYNVNVCMPPMDFDLLLAKMSGRVQNTNMSAQTLDEFAKELMELLAGNDGCLRNLLKINDCQESVNVLGSLPWNSTCTVHAINITGSAPFRMIFASSAPRPEESFVQIQHDVSNFPRYVIQFSFKE